VASPQATPFDTILAQCRDLACERLVHALSGMLEKADESLSGLIREARDPNVQKLYLVTRNKVTAQKDTIQTQFRMRFLREFQERSNRVKKIGESFAAIDLSSLELELVAEEDLNETLKFNAMATKLRQYCDEELVALDQRVGVLIGDASLQAEDNPFTPQTICDAYKQTCRQIDSNVDVRMVLLKLFDDHVLDDIRAVYKEVNALLVQNEILPKIRAGGQRTRSPGAGESPQAKTEGGGEEQDLFSALQKLLVKPAAPGAAPAGISPLAQAAGAMLGQPQLAGQPGVVAGQAGIAGGQPAGQPGGVAAGQAGGAPLAAQGADLLRSLTRIQFGDTSAVAGLPIAVVAGQPGTTNILHELKGTSLGSGMNQMDAMTLDIMAMLFDQLFDDPKIPANVKGVIGRLQIPMLKVAIADKSFFSKKTHPARRMLDTLGEIAARMPADVDASDDVFRRLESILQELIDGFEDDITIFDAVRERLQAVVTEEDQRAEQQTLSAAKEIEQKESLGLAKTIAQAEIRVRVRASDAPRSIVDFLAQQWIKFLLVVHVRDGEDSETWRDALETIDLLLWSVEPKETLEDRRALVASVSDLLKRLKDGLNDAGVDDDVRQNLFSELRRIYIEIISRSAKEAPADEVEDRALLEQARGTAETGVEAVPGGAEKSELPESLGKPELMPSVGTAEQVASVATPEGSTAFGVQKELQFPEEPAIAAREQTVPGDKSPEEAFKTTLPDLEFVLESPTSPREETLPSPVLPAEAPAETPSEGLQLIPAQKPETLPTETDIEKTWKLAPIEIPEVLPGVVPEIQLTEVEQPAPLPVIDLPPVEPAREPAEQKPSAAPPQKQPEKLTPAPEERAPILTLEPDPRETRLPQEKELPVIPTLSARPAEPPVPKPSPPTTVPPRTEPTPAPKIPAPVSTATSKPPVGVPLPSEKAAPTPSAATASKPPSVAPQPTASVVQPGKPASQKPPVPPQPGTRPVSPPGATSPVKPAVPAPPAAVSPAHPGAMPTAKPPATARPAAAPASATSATSSVKPSVPPPPAGPARPSAAPGSQPGAPLKPPATPPRPAVPATGATTATPSAPLRPAAPPGAAGAVKPPQATAPRPAIAAGQPGAAPGARAPQPRSAAPGARKPAAAPAAKAASVAEGRADKPDSLDFVPAVTVKNPFGEGEVVVNDLDLDFTQPAKTTGAKQEADAALPENLGVGSWVEIRDKGDSRQLAKLSFVTPLKTRYLFVNRRGKTVLECSRAELARRFKLGEIAMTVEATEPPLFDRIAEGVLGKLAGSK
jgi:hypothetical protein